ncbi:sodium:solute symporter family transporter [Rickettsia endosymbiont of Halotydeus destructor]|uniref:sodium:solute symporter family transporter n=1 Tax=Rickettsia endosymbiont of Halotydeus destructor TaxID=2996754 RepID=UPI003BB1AB1C
MSYLYSNIDIIIFIGFLVINIVIALLNIKGIKNLREYAIGKRNFSTGTIVATLIATWIGTSSFLMDSSQIYTKGLFYLIPSIVGGVVSWLLISYFLAPRMERFLGALSVAEIMGEVYGNKVRVITSVASILTVIGKIAMQFHVASLILELFFSISSFYVNLLIAIVIINYSVFGGIRSVTFTEMVQFFTYSAVIPVIGIIAWNVFSDPNITANSVVQNHIINFHELYSYKNSKFWVSVSIFVYFSIPALGPSIFQRILIAKDTKQISSAFFIASIICFCLSGLVIWIAMLLLSQAPNIEPNILFLKFIKGYTGFKGLIVGGIMAMIIASTNSYINAATVTFSNDIAKKSSLAFSYIIAVIIGISGFILSFYTKNLVNLFLIVSSFYVLLITMPLILLIFGFRSTAKSFFIGMIAAVITILLWYLFSIRDITGIYAVLPATLVNLVFFVGSHYFLKQSGGFNSFEMPSALKMLRLERKHRLIRLYCLTKTFNIFKFWQNTLPNQEITYTYVGVFIIASIFSSLYTTPAGKIQNHLEIYNFIYHSVLAVSTILITYPLWPLKFKKKNIIAFFWFIGMFVILIFFSSLLVIASNFYKVQLMIFMINLIIVATLFRWHITLIMTISGVIVSVKFYKYFMGENLLINEDNLQSKIIYLLTLFSSLLIIFLKPKQEQHQLIKSQNNHLETQVIYKEEELQKLLDLKHEFLRNINHEIHTPLTGIISLGEILWEKYDIFNEKQRRAAVEIIAKSSTRLNSLMNNILDFSKLSTLSYNLNKEDLNISELLYERIKICSKLYLNNKELSFVFDTDNNIIFNCDRHYIKHTFDNLIINAITYSNEGIIKITLQKTDNRIFFKIKDNGIGVPKKELKNIFGVFVVSSKTRTSAGGRGVGLALCKKVIELHNGKIWAENDSKGKTSFIFTLPY